ncbi:MAG: NUDIX hydrolase [Bryobacteraceae bacterium]|jgi:8-oxo-dGTP diphosphatase
MSGRKSVTAKRGLAGGSPLRTRNPGACPTQPPRSGAGASACQPLAPGSEGNTDDRRYPKRPLIGVGALIFRRGRILMAQRGKQPMKGAWSLPGGALEIGEPLDAAVRREVREETGLAVKPVKVFEIFERIICDSRGTPEYHYVLIDYICRVTGGDLRAGDDVCRVEWVRERDLAELEITEGTLAVIERAFRGRAVPPG